MKKIIAISLICLIFSFILLKIVQNSLNYSSSQSIQKLIEPNLVKNFAIDSLQKIETIDQYKKWIEAETDQIWQEIEQETGVSKQQCEHYKIENYATYLKETEDFYEGFKNLPTISDEYVSLIKSVMVDLQIQPNSLRILAFNHFCPAAADDCAILINEELFKKLSPLAQKFCIAHELQHFIYQDNSMSSALSDLIKIDMKTLDHDHPINKLLRMLELRADIFAAFAGKEYAQGYKEFIDTTLEIIGEGKGVTHPKNALRLTYADHIKTAIA